MLMQKYLPYNTTDLLHLRKFPGNPKDHETSKTTDPHASLPQSEAKLRYLKLMPAVAGLNATSFQRALTCFYFFNQMCLSETKIYRSLSNKTVSTFLQSKSLFTHRKRYNCCIFYICIYTIG